MSAPVAGERDGWFGEPIVHFINIKSFIGCGACGYVGEGGDFPAFRACSGSGGSAAGRRSRSSTYPLALLVNLPRRAVTKALMLVLLIVQGGETTPIRLKSARSFILGIRGSGVSFM